MAIEWNPRLSLSERRYDVEFDSGEMVVHGRLPHFLHAATTVARDEGRTDWSDRTTLTARRIGTFGLPYTWGACVV